MSNAIRAVCVAVVAAALGAAEADTIVLHEDISLPVRDCCFLSGPVTDPFFQLLKGDIDHE